MLTRGKAELSSKEENLVLEQGYVHRLTDTRMAPGFPVIAPLQPNTSSPILNLVTPSPTSSMIPETSNPRTPFSGARFFKRPDLIL